MKFIILLAYFIHGGTSAVTTLEFDTMEACAAAAESITKGDRKSYTPNLHCVDTRDGTTRNFVTTP